MKHSQLSFKESFTPKLLTVLREGYSLSHVKHDLVAGLTVAIVALPLSMAIAIASGLSPERGLYSSIIGGLLVSLLGGSRYQIAGPAGAFIVVVASAMQQFGLEGLCLATFMSGFILALMGIFKLGTYIKYIPYPVTIGFTAGIAVIILLSQIKELLGLELAHEPSDAIDKIIALFKALPTFKTATVTISTLTLAIIVTLRRFKPKWPIFMIAAVLGSLATFIFQLPIETIGTRFGSIPSHLPSIEWPKFSLEKCWLLLPTALTFALLGGIESLLSAVVADGMSGARHRSNCELVAQGIANIFSPLFGGFCITGTIARTATNVRAGSKGPLSGIFHSLFVLLFIVIAAPLAAYIPLASLAAILIVVAWNMIEKTEVAVLIQSSKGDAAVLLVTFLFVIFKGLSEGILVGFGLGSLLFLHRIAQSVKVENYRQVFQEDLSDSTSKESLLEGDEKGNSDILILRISGAFFFGSAASVINALESIAERPKKYVLDFSSVAMIDSTATVTLQQFIRKFSATGTQTYIVGASKQIQKALFNHGLTPHKVPMYDNLKLLYKDLKKIEGVSFQRNFS